MTVCALTAFSALFLLKDTTKEKYFPRTQTYFTQQTQLSNGYAEHMNMIRANRETGFVSAAEVQDAITHASKMRKSNKTLNISWRFKGPDNVGGRTRALAIDKQDTTHLMAGAVSGGLWDSFNGGVTWQPYDPDFKISNVSSIAQGSDGTFYVATGSRFDGSGNTKNLGSDFVGTGLFKLTGNGNSQLLVGPSADFNYNAEWSTIEEVVVDPRNPQRIFAAMNRGLRESTDGGVTWTNPIGLTAGCRDIAMSDDGKILVAYSNSIYVSTDDGATYTPTVFSGASRIELAIAPSNTNIMYASIAASNSCLFGVYRSSDAGTTWIPLPNTPDYFNGGLQCQGNYDNTIAVYPTDPGRIIVGGVSLFQWRQSSVDPATPQGEWRVFATTNEFNITGTRNPTYVHADKHKIVFHPTNPNKVYIGSDGGVAYSDNISSDFPTYSINNLGYNVTQFYDIAVGPRDYVAGGTQDNGTQMVGFDFNTGKSAVQLRGADGFDTEMFTVNPSLGIASIYNGNITRVQGIGTSLRSSTINNAGIYSGTLAGLCNNAAGGIIAGCSPLFYTTTAIWESFNHTLTKDSVVSRLDQTTLPPLPAGTSIIYKSKNNDIPLEGITPVDILPTDTTTLEERFLSATNKGYGAGDTLHPDTLIVAYDTLLFDYKLKQVAFHLRGRTPYTRSYTIGDTLQYNNIFHNRPTNIPARPPLVITIDSTQISYQDPNVVFNYEYEFPDIVQTMVALFNVRGRLDPNERNVWLSKDILKGASVNEPRWIQLTLKNTPSIQGSIPADAPIATQFNSKTTLAAAFTRDGNHLFYGTSDGELYRIDGLNDIDISQIDISLPDNHTLRNTVTHHRLFDFGSRAITGITVDPQNKNNVIVTLGNYGQAQYVQRSTNAIQTSGVTFSTISGAASNALPNSPVYEAVIDRRDPNKVLVATEIGVFATENAFTTATVVDNGNTVLDVRWTEENTGLGRVPVMAIKQMIFDSDVGAVNEGKIYIGTHGRGIFETDQLVGLGDDNITSNDNKFKPSLTVYPNPVEDNMSLEVMLNSREQLNIEIYTVTGQLVERSILGNVTVGKNRLNIGVEGLKRGTYIVRSIQGNDVGTTKFIKR